MSSKLDGILNGTIECPVQILDDNNALTLNVEGRSTEEQSFLPGMISIYKQKILFSVQLKQLLNLSSISVKVIHFKNEKFFFYPKKESEEPFGLYILFYYVDTFNSTI
jgi:hypothetical protein